MSTLLLYLCLTAVKGHEMEEVMLCQHRKRTPGFTTFAHTRFLNPSHVFLALKIESDSEPRVMTMWAKGSSVLV